MPAPMTLPPRRARLRAIDALLSLGVLLPALLTGALIVALLMSGRAHAEPAACTGDDLIERWKTSDPTKVARIEAQAAALPNGVGIFWKVEKPGASASYLLGTMHVTDPRVVAMPKGAPEAFATATTVIVESDEAVDPKKVSAALLSDPSLTMLPNGASIADFLSADDKKTLTDGLQARGVPFAAVARMKPWMIASVVSLPACEMSRKAAGALFLDQKLAQDAKAEGKTLKGLETVVEQVRALDDLPMAFHVDALVESLKLGDLTEDVMETTTALYLKGRIGTVMPMLKAASQEVEPDAAQTAADFEQRIVTDRNHVMATRAAPILAAGNAFMAVGALHLPGPEGLVALLREGGFSVTPMP